MSFNQQVALDAERRSKDAIATLQAADNFPTGASARADAIVGSARCSKQTLKMSGADVLSFEGGADAGDLLLRGQINDGLRLASLNYSRGMQKKQARELETL